MSQENLDTVRGGFEWFRENGSFPAHLATADFAWDMSHFDGWLERQVYEGMQGTDEFIAEWGGTWDDWTLEVEALHDAGEKVVAIVHQRGRSKLTGTVVEMSMAMVWSFRDGKESRMELYSEPAEALRAQGLQE